MNSVFPRIDKSTQRVLLSSINNTPSREICGFLVEEDAKTVFRRILNLGGIGEFWIDQLSLIRIVDDVLDAGGVIQAFVHSHSSGLELSTLDKIYLNRSRWPWLVVVAKDSVLEYKWYPNSSNEN